ncbi:unnamed protein product [Sphagnum jensenii]|uniref:Uncharacterized protein n=1 Tax=Sphagnum jensenii TaxID=128206 RepID=A0ABP0XBV4_9BRYO
MNYDRNLLDRFQDLFGTLKVRGSSANSVMFSFYFDVFAFCGVFSTLCLFNCRATKTTSWTRSGIKRGVRGSD